jgi:hypothetical protein
MESLVLIEPLTIELDSNRRLIVSYSVTHVSNENWENIQSPIIYLKAIFNPREVSSLNVLILLNKINTNTAKYFNLPLCSTETVIWKDKLCLKVEYAGSFSAAAAAARRSRLYSQL